MRQLSTLTLAVFAIILATATPSSAGASAARIDTIAPGVAGYGESVTISGIGFGGPGVIVRVGGVVADKVSATGTRVTFRVPLGVPTGRVVVTATNPGGHTGSIGFDVSGLVTLRLDEAHRVAGPMGPAGGILSAESDGLRFHLTIPAGALAQPEEIVMTPIMTIGGLPLHQFLGAVHFAPEGLHFFKAATLAIELPEGANVQGLVGFSAAGNGENLHLIPFTMMGQAISLVVPHFSVAGLGTALPTVLAAVHCQQPTLECTYTNRLAQALVQAVQKVCGNNCTTSVALDARIAAIQDEFATPEIELLREWFGHVAARLDDDARESDAALVGAGHDYAAWLAWINGKPCGAIDCADEPSLATDIEQGREKLGAAFRAALQRAQAVCEDRLVVQRIAEIELLGLMGLGGLPDDETGIRNEFACQLVIDGALPVSVRLGDVAPFTARFGLRTGGPAGPVTPLPGLQVTVRIEGCGLIEDSTSFTGTADASGQLAIPILITLPCVGPLDATTVIVSVADLTDATGLPVALGRAVSFSARIDVAITVSPENATVSRGGTIDYVTDADGLGPLFAWTASGGTITPGPSATATYTAGSLAGLFAVTATSVDDPTQSQTVAVTVGSGSPAPPEPPADCSRGCIFRGFLWNVLDGTRTPFPETEVSITGDQLVWGCYGSGFGFFASGTAPGADGHFSWRAGSFGCSIGADRITGTMTASSLEFDFEVTGYAPPVLFRFVGTRVGVN